MPWGILFAGGRQSATPQNPATVESSMEVKA